MRYAPEHNDAIRERILDAASRLFRQHGIAAVGLAKIMAEANLTVGTFYTHFKSKEGVALFDHGSEPSITIDRECLREEPLQRVGLRKRWRNGAGT